MVSRPFLARVPLTLALLILVLSCVSGPTAPHVAPNGTLSLNGLEESDSEKGPLRVVYASPTGELHGPSEITILFNKPMRALELAGNEAMVPARVEPPVKGEWQWVGTRAATFIPARPDSAKTPDADGGGSFKLLGATNYRITVPKGTRSLDGDSLADDYVFTFATPRPQVVSSSPYDRDDHLEAGSAFELYFNQPVRDEEVARAVSLTAGDKPVPFTVERQEAENPKRVRLVPKAPLPLDAAVALSVSESLKGEEGPLPMGKAARFGFKTYGPLVVSSLTCSSTEGPHNECDPEGGLTLTFSNPVPFKAAKRAITVEPAVKLHWAGYYADDQEVSTVYLSGSFKAAQTYTVRVNGPLADAYKQPLTKPFSGTVKLDDYWPVAQIGMTNGVFEAGTSKKDPTIASVNADDLELVTAKLGEAEILAFENDKGGTGFDALAAVSGAKKKTMPKGMKNVTTRTRVAVADVLGAADARGPFAVGIRYAAGRSNMPTEQKSIAVVTDLAVTAKVSRAGSFFWVTRLSDAKPVANAEVKIRRPDEAGVTVTTDADGFATFTAAQFTPHFDEETAIAFVRSGADMTFKHLGDNVENWDFSSAEDAAFGMVFSDRGIYRPGDTVRLKGIVREEVWNGTRTPGQGHTVHLSIRGPADDKIVEVDKPLTRFGSFAADVPVPAAGKLGSYYVTAVVDGGKGNIGSTFEVAEYRPVEFEVKTESDRPEYVRGAAATWTGRGDFLFGAPMAGGQVRTYVSRQETSFVPDNTDGFSVDDRPYYAELPEKAPRESVVASNQGKLDARGSTSTHATLSLPGQRGTESVTCSVDVTDLSRQVVSSSTTAIVHPASYYVGTHVDAYFVDAQKPTRATFVAVTPKGDRVSGRPIKVELLRRKWVTSKQQNGASALTTVSTLVDNAVGGCSLVSARTPVGCDLTPTEGGYYILRATSIDEAKNPVASSTSIYATSNQESAGGGGWADSDKMDLKLVTDHESYKVGQKARILVKSPFAHADALVTVERGGIYSKRLVKLSGPTPTIDVPITDDLRPNAFVSVTVLRGRSKPAPTQLGQPDVGLPAYRVGVAHLAISPEDKRLKVALKPSKLDFLPGEQAKVDVDVTDVAGKPAKTEVTLYVVDEGVLSLIDYKTPDPIPVFGAPRSLKVATLESRAQMAKLFDPLGGLGADKGLAGGGGDAGSGGSARRDFRASAYFNPSVITDDKGHASVSFKLPDSLTTYRVMAVVTAEDDRFGFADKRVTTSRTLMARPAFPRFLRAGDAFEAGVVVTSKGLKAADIDVALTASGITLKGDKTKRVHIATGESAEVRFAMLAEAVGPATFHFDVSGGDAKDAVEIKRDVKPPMALEAVALYGETKKESAEKLGDLSAIRGDTGELTVTLSSSALVGLDAGTGQLLDYPYGCTEQLTSQLVPLVTMRSLAKDFGLVLPANIDDVVQKTVAKILTHQHPDGGFGFWADSIDENTWVTAYAVWGLAQLANDKPGAVPKESLDSAVSYLRRSLDSPEARPIDRASRAFILDVMADAGAPDPGRVNVLFEERESLPLFSKALLLHAMVTVKADPASIVTLTKEIETSLRLDGPVARSTENLGDDYRELLDSETRTSALVLRGLMSARPNHPLGAPLAMGLLADRKGGAWRTTQETAWSLIALVDYRKAQEKVEPNFDAHVFLGENDVLTAAFRGRSLEQKTQIFPAAKLGEAQNTALGFSLVGDGKLFYQARLRYARKTLPTDVIDRGFFVEKRLRKVTPDDLAEALDTVPNKALLSFAGSDLVLADVVVVTPKPRRFVVVDDPLPAGFEAVDMRLATSSGRLGVDYTAPRSDDGDEAMGRADGFAWYTKEVRDDRVLFFVDHMPAGVYRYRYIARATSLGTFVVPPTRAEEMYTPETFGRTGTTRIDIKP